MNKSIFLKFPFILSIILVITILPGCNLFKDSKSEEVDYKELKQMVIDIIQTEDGKKAIQESISEPKLKKQMVVEDKEVQKIVREEFLAPENKEKIKKMYEDPKFASELAKSLSKENEKILKDLMKDPEYRKMMVEVMNEPEFEKMILDIMKSNAYRTQMMLVIKDSLESPMFRDDLLKLMEEASKKALEPEKKDKKEANDKGGEDGGES